MADVTPNPQMVNALWNDPDPDKTGVSRRQALDYYWQLSEEAQDRCPKQLRVYARQHRGAPRGSL